MLFKSEKWGSLTRDILQNPETGTFLSIIPEYSSAIHTLILNGKNGKNTLIQEDTDPEGYIGSILKHPSCKLSPFPSRLKNASYTFNGIEYSLPKNDRGGKHAIHGFLSFAKFEREIPEFENQLHYSYNFEGVEGYPFTFRIEIVYTLNENELIVETRYNNTYGKEFPLGDGWHHYFTTPEGSDQYSITLPVDKIMILDEDLLPNGDVQPVKIENMSLKGVNLDACYYVEEGQSIVETVLTHKEKKMTLWQETGKDKYNFLVVYTPGGRDQIAIEPLTCGPDMLNSGLNSILLAVNKPLILKMGIRVE